MTTKRIRLGKTGPEIFPIAIGCMGMGEGGAYEKTSDEDSITAIHEAIERGANLFDTGDFYGMGKNELLVGRAIKGKRDKVVLSVKYGAQRGPDGAFLGFDASPAATKTALTHSLTRLGVDHVDIYRPARLDPKTPIEETMGALVDLVKGGYVKHISLSEVGADTIRRAAKIHPIVDLQIEYALISRKPEEKIIPVLAELGIGMTAYGVLSRGLLTGSKPTQNDWRSHSPRFTGSNGEKNAALADELARLAKARGVTAAQLAIAYTIAKGKQLGFAIAPTIGVRTKKHIPDTFAALDIELSNEEVAALEKAVPAEAVAGTRYPEAMMHTLDSEK